MQPIPNVYQKCHSDCHVSGSLDSLENEIKNSRMFWRERWLPKNTMPWYNFRIQWDTSSVQRQGLQGDPQLCHYCIYQAVCTRDLQEFAVGMTSYILDMRVLQAGNSDRNYSGHRPAWMAAVWTCQMSDWTNTSHSALAHHVSHPLPTFHLPHSTTTQDTFHTHPLRWNSCVVRRWRFCKQVSKYNFKASYHCLNGSAHC